MAHPDHPLVMYVCERGPAWPFAIGISEEACELLAPHADDIACEPAAPGVWVYARNEKAFGAALRTLRSRYGGGRLRMSGPHVRHWPGDPPREPVMTVLARVPRSVARTVRWDLARPGGS